MDSAFQDRRRRPIFIHSRLDDLPLSMEAFRVYCHLARRANDALEAWPSYRTIAEKCFRGSYPKSSVESIRRKAMAAVKELIEWNLIAVEHREAIDGGLSSNLYSLTDDSEWKDTIDNPSENVRKSREYHPRKPKNTEDSTGGGEWGSPGVVSGVHQGGGEWGSPGVVSGVHQGGEWGSPQEVNPIEVNPIEGTPENTPLSPPGDKASEPPPQVVTVEVMEPTRQISNEGMTDNQTTSQVETVKVKDFGLDHLPPAATNASQKSENIVKTRSQLPAYRLSWERDGIREEFLSWMCLRVMSGWSPYKQKTPTPHDARNWVRNREKEGCRDLVENRYDQMLSEQANPAVASVFRSQNLVKSAEVQSAIQQGLEFSKSRSGFFS